MSRNVKRRLKRAVVCAFLILSLVVAGCSAWVIIDAYVETPLVLARVYQSGRLVLRLEDFKPEWVEMLLRVDDPGFYHHPGVDMLTPGGGLTTITQGLVKAYFFNGFRPGFLRLNKIRQTLIALVFNARIAKKEQLHLFINSVYLGDWHGREVIGFQDAARTYFGKDFSQLTRDEYLSLVAMMVAPATFHVLEQPQKNRERVRRIERMLNGACKPASVFDVYYKNCG